MTDHTRATTQATTHERTTTQAHMRDARHTRALDMDYTGNSNLRAGGK